MGWFSWDGLTGVLQESFKLILQLIAAPVRYAIKVCLSILNDLIVTTPYPKDPQTGEALLFAAPPAGSEWHSFYEVYTGTAQPYAYILLIIGMFIILFQGIFKELMPTVDFGKKKQKLVLAFLIITLWWPIAVLLLSFTDAFAGAMMAAGSDGTNDLGLVRVVTLMSTKNLDGLQLGYYMLFNFAYALELTTIIGLCVVWVIRLFIIYVMTPIIPVMVALWTFDMPGMDKVANACGDWISKYIAIVFMSVPGALIIGLAGDMIDIAVSDENVQTVNQSGETPLSANNLTNNSSAMAPPSVGSQSGTSGQVIHSPQDAVGAISGTGTSTTATGGSLAFGDMAFIMFSFAIAIALPLVAGFGPLVLVYGVEKTKQLAKTGAKTGMAAATGGASMAAGAAGGMADELGVGEKMSEVGTQLSAGGKLGAALTRDGIKKRMAGSRMGSKVYAGGMAARQAAGEVGDTVGSVASPAASMARRGANAGASLTSDFLREDGRFGSGGGDGIPFDLADYDLTDEDGVEDAFSENMSDTWSEMDAEKREAVKSMLTDVAEDGDDEDVQQAVSYMMGGSAGGGGGGGGFGDRQQPWAPSKNVWGLNGLTNGVSWLRGEATRFDKNHQKGDKVGRWIAGKAQEAEVDMEGLELQLPDDASEILEMDGNPFTNDQVVEWAAKTDIGKGLVEQELDTAVLEQMMDRQNQTLDESRRMLLKMYKKMDEESLQQYQEQAEKHTGDEMMTNVELQQQLQESRAGGELAFQISQQVQDVQTQASQIELQYEEGNASEKEFKMAQDAKDALLSGRDMSRDELRDHLSTLGLEDDYVAPSTAPVAGPGADYDTEELWEFDEPQAQTE